ncbi:MAG: B12-binding domain-containing radical SAM protein [Thermoplasmatales archaeon]|nr:B12-binding domain-containing radical SAM protein [Thermoplasmatales archaeon]
MKILLVKPYPNPKHNFINKFSLNSLTLKQIAAITPPEHDVDIIDEKYEKIIYSKKYDLVGISILAFNSTRGYEISKNYKKLDITVVFGGYHASLMPHEVMKYADAVVIGEAENNWQQLLKDLQNGTLKKIYKNSDFVKPEDIPPARHDIGNYTLIEPIQATRGCPIGCEFCAMNVIEGNKFRARSIEDVINEIKSIKSKKILFTDASLTINLKYTKELFSAMKDLNKKFWCFGNIDVFSYDKEFLELSREAGVEKWILGIESISQENINQIGKTSNKIENYAQAIKNIYEYGMLPVGSIIFGYDSDTVESFDETLKAVYDWKLNDVTFCILNPIPGTRLFNRLEKENRITNYDWTLFSEKNINFKPKNMSEEELFENIKRLSYEYYSFKILFKRGLNVASYSMDKLFIFFISNLITKFFILKRVINDTTPVI